MDKGDYLNSNQLYELMRLTAFANECGVLAGETNEPRIHWQTRLKTADTFATKVINERVACLSDKAREGLKKRVRKLDVLVIESNLVTIKENQKQQITLDWDDFLDILEMAQWTCCRCSQGEKVKNCKFKQLLLSLGVPVARENPADGECPYRWENEIRWINPDGKEIKP